VLTLSLGAESDCDHYPPLLERSPRISSSVSSSRRTGDVRSSHLLCKVISSPLDISKSLTIMAVMMDWSLEGLESMDRTWGSSNILKCILCLNPVSVAMGGLPLVNCRFAVVGGNC
jgi:hypothetical protein